MQPSKPLKRSATRSRRSRLENTSANNSECRCVRTTLAWPCSATAAAAGSVSMMEAGLWRWRRRATARRDPQASSIEVSRDGTRIRTRSRCAFGARPIRSGRLELDQASSETFVHRICAAFRIELPKQRLKMEFDRMLRDAEASGGFLVAETVCYRRQHLYLARRQQRCVIARVGSKCGLGQTRAAHAQAGGGSS